MKSRVLKRGVVHLIAFAVWILARQPLLLGQGNAGLVRGTVVNPSKAAVPGALVRLENPESGYLDEVKTGADGTFSIANVPFNTYQLTVAAQDFDTFTRNVDVRSPAPISLNIELANPVTLAVSVVESQDVLARTSTEHTDIDRELIDKIPLESQSSSLSSLVTLASPGVVADSNGLFHGLGDHAENSFSVDGQPITDQQSKVFSNQLPLDAVQSLEVIEGAPPAEFGGKTSLIINATTRSGLGQTPPQGQVSTSYGTFGSSNVNANAAYGNQKAGNFISLGVLNTGRFLDAPEFSVLHAKGNEQNFFDRLDYKPSSLDRIQLNLGFTRSWFQTPNTWDQQLQTCTILSTLCDPSRTIVLNPVTGNPLGPTDQRSQIRTFNIAPTWTRTPNPNVELTLGAFVRHDQYNYYPSPDPFADLGPLQNESVSQLRFLTNAGIRATWNYIRRAHNIKAGATYEQTFLTENDGFGIVNPGLLPGLGCPDPSNPVCAILAPIDLTTGGQIYHFRGHTDIKNLGLYVQDTITKGPWSINIGLRADFYNGLQAVASQVQPRPGIAYSIRRTNTVLRISYARTMETPFNENLILSGTGCTNPVVNAIMTVSQGFACTGSPLTPGFRNEFHAGLEQAWGPYFKLSGEYIWKYTHNAYDFNVFATTPITLPIEWHNSKIPGFALRATITNYHGLTAYAVMSGVAARFFPPTLSGIAPPQPPGVFRIDHDQALAQTTHIQYQPPKHASWIGFNWRYDSGIVAGAVPCLAATATCAFSTSVADGGMAQIPEGQIGMINNTTGLPLTADQEFQAGLTCDGAHATPTRPLPSTCLASQFASTLVKIPAPNTQNDDHNPQRVQPRHLFDVALGNDNLFHGDHKKWSGQLTVINLTNKVALYNFLSTFSGTHYVTPRTFTGEIGFHF